MKYYHISKTYLGEKILLTPKVPSSSILSFEGNIPRICVSEKLFYCLRSITSSATLQFKDILLEFKAEIFPFYEEEDKETKTINYPAVYSTTQIPYLPPSHGDFRRNKEHWFLNKTEFIFEGFIDLKYLLDNKTIKLVRENETMIVKDLNKDNFRVMNGKEFFI